MRSNQPKIQTQQQTPVFHIIPTTTEFPLESSFCSPRMHPRVEGKSRPSELEINAIPPLLALFTRIPSSQRSVAMKRGNAHGNAVWDKKRCSRDLTDSLQFRWPQSVRATECWGKSLPNADFYPLRLIKPTPTRSDWDLTEQSLPNHSRW